MFQGTGALYKCVSFLGALAFLASACGRTPQESTVSAHTVGSPTDTSDRLTRAQCRTILQRATQLVLQQETSETSEPVILHTKDIDCLSFEVMMKDQLSAQGTAVPNAFHPLLAQLFEMARIGSKAADDGGIGGGDDEGGIGPGPGDVVTPNLVNGVKIRISGDLDCMAADLIAMRSQGRLAQIEVTCTTQPLVSGSYRCTGILCTSGDKTMTLFDESFEIRTADGRRAIFSYATTKVLAPIEFFGTPSDDCNAQLPQNLSKTLYNLPDPQLASSQLQIDSFCQEFLRTYTGGRLWCSRITGGELNTSDANSSQEMQSRCKTMIASHAARMWALQ